MTYQFKSFFCLIFNSLPHSTVPSMVDCFHHATWRDTKTSKLPWKYFLRAMLPNSLKLKSSEIRRGMKQSLSNVLLIIDSSSPAKSFFSFCFSAFVLMNLIVSRILENALKMRWISARTAIIAVSNWSWMHASRATGEHGGGLRNVSGC